MMALQAVYGVIPKVYGKGRAAKQLFDFMARWASLNFFPLDMCFQFQPVVNVVVMMPELSKLA